MPRPAKGIRLWLRPEERNPDGTLRGLGHPRRPTQNQHGLRCARLRKRRVRSRRFARQLPNQAVSFSLRSGPFHIHASSCLVRVVDSVSEAAKLQDNLAYPPRLLRAERAAAYLGMGRSTFPRLVAEGVLPKPKPIRGVVVWDRLALDAYVDDITDDNTNTFDRILRG
jgi:predicted DNA-binding transcriptional regulator AlpA